MRLGLTLLFADLALAWGWPGERETVCYTRVESTQCPHRVTTTWSTHNTPCCAQTSTVTVRHTTTPHVTSTVTVTHTSTSVAPTKYRTRTATVTATTTGQSVVTITVTSTVETDTATATATVPAPATFVPVQSSLPGSSYSGSGGSDPVAKLKKRNTSPRRSLHRGLHYPQDVTCYVWQPEGGRCTTAYKTVTKTVTAPAVTDRCKSTSTVTVTTVSVPHAKTTTTVTVTTGTTTVSTATATSSVTTTTTVTPTTLYAACATNNLADMVSGTPIIEGTGGFQEVYDLTTDTAYDCCVAAITYPDNTDIWAFEPGASPANCFIGGTGDTCPNPSTNPSTVTTDPSGNLIVGNAFCGEITTAVAEDDGGD